MLSELWNAIRKALLILAVLFAFFVLAEAARVILLFYRLNAVAGLAVLAVAALVALYLLVRLISWARARRALAPPPMPALPDAGHKEMNRYCRFLARYLRFLAENPALDEAAGRAAEQKASEIEEVLGAHPLNDDLARAIQQAENDVIAPIHAVLRTQASDEVQAAAVEVMQTAAGNLYGGLDLLALFRRNADMVARVAETYRAQPGLLDKLLLLRDAAGAASALPCRRASSLLAENLSAQLPAVGRAADDVARAVGAGFMTFAVGRAAIARGSALRTWIPSDARRELLAQSGAFLTAAGDLFVTSVLPGLRARLGIAAPAEAGADDPLATPIAAAVKAAVKGLDIPPPAPPKAESAVFRPPIPPRGPMPVAADPPSSSSARHHGSRHHRRPASKGVGRVLGTFGQRLKYTLVGRWVHR